MNGALYSAVLSQVESRVLGPIRERLLRSLSGAIVEVGAGTGPSFAHYDRSANVVALEPDASMARRAYRRIRESSATIAIREADDRWLDTLPARSIDVVVFPLVLCTVADPMVTLLRTHRVLREHGKIVVLEHVRAAGGSSPFWDLLGPMWRTIAGGCHIDRDTETTIDAAGFDVDRLKSTRLPWFALGQSLVEGEAFKRASPDANGQKRLPS